MTQAEATIRRIIREKQAGVLSGTAAMRGILQALQEQVVGDLGRASLTDWDAHRLRRMSDALEVALAGWKMRARAEISGRLDGMWQMGKALVDEPLSASGLFQMQGFHLSEASLEVLKDFAFQKIAGLRQAAFGKIKAELTLGILGQRTPQEVAKAIGMDLKDPSVFRTIAGRAEAITKTEMGRTFSGAAQLRMEQAAKHVPGMEKQWRHAGHPREARLGHLLMDARHIPVEEKFDVGGVMMSYPRDPSAPASEVIHCGCDTVPYMADWFEGAEVREAAAAATM